MRLPCLCMGALGGRDASLAIGFEPAVFGELPEMSGPGSDEENSNRRELAGHWNTPQARSQNVAHVLGCALPGRQLRK